MKELRIIFTIVFLVSLVSLTHTSLARESEHEEMEIHRSGNHSDDHESKNTKKLKKLREQQKEKQKKLRDRLEEAKKRTMSVSIQTGTLVTPKPTNTGSTASTNIITPITRSTTVSYRTPDGSASMFFSVTTKSGIITSASSTKKSGGTSGYYQDLFAAGLSSAVVGKKASGLTLNTIGGASLTTTAFKNFVNSNF